MEALDCARLAQRAVRDLEPELQRLVTMGIQNQQLFQAQIALARSLAESADQKYFDLQEKGVAENIWMNWFGKARFATAIATGFGEETPDAAADAIYELTAMFDEPSGLLQFIKAK